MATPRPHWRSPLTLTLAFMSGLCFAIGHHLFYLSLDGIIVENATFTQQVNTGIGTALAFLVRSAFVIAVGTAYVQVLWYSLRSERLSISSIDALASLTSTFQAFGSPRIWRHPIVVSLALLSWVMPFAAVVPPTTLTVRIAQLYDSNMSNLPTLNFGELGGMATEITWFDDLVDEAHYNGPTQALSRLVMASALQGTITSREAIAPNSSYAAHFFGPSLHCEASSPALVGGLNHVFGCDISNVSTVSGQPVTHGCLAYSNDLFFFESDETTTFAYVAWTPKNNSLFPFPSSNRTDGRVTLPSFSATTSQNGTLSTYLGSFHDSPATLFLAIRPNAGMQPLFVSNCSLWNVSYNVNFTFENNIQSTKIMDVRALNTIPAVSNFGDVTLLDQHSNAHANYQAIMEIFGEVMVGVITLNFESYYASLVGLDPNATYEGSSILGTDIMSTDLAMSDELGTLSKHLDLPTYSSNVSMTTNGPLNRLIEELFQNVTLSLFSNDRFLTSDTIPTNVTVWTTHSVYVYTAWRLLLAYGLAILFTLIAVGVGFTTMYKAGASYSNKFSTILRTTRDLGLDRLISDHDWTGADPLPKYISKTRVALGLNAPSGTYANEAERSMLQKVVSNEDISMIDTNELINGGNGKDQPIVVQRNVG